MRLAVPAMALAAERWFLLFQGGVRVGLARVEVRGGATVESRHVGVAVADGEGMLRAIGELTPRA